MLTTIELKDLPMRTRGTEKSPMYLFAEDTTKRFLESYEVGQIAEVTGWPTDDTRDAIWNASKAAQSIKDRLFYTNRDKDLRDEVKVFRSGSRVFMKRLEPIQEDPPKRKPNPYPGDFPRVH